ncbi:MAG: hypothetical protein H8E27_02315 [Verrucomicrobia subdivision 3 bacterium]|nr:hypothetical protein [Limisphaerales bacterium]
MAHNAPAGITDPFVEKAVRQKLNEPTGELTNADLAKVTRLDLSRTQITDADLKDVAKLKKLTRLHLNGTQITEAGLKDLAKGSQGFGQDAEAHLL